MYIIDIFAKQFTLQKKKFNIAEFCKKFEMNNNDDKQNKKCSILSKKHLSYHDTKKKLKNFDEDSMKITDEDDYLKYKSKSKHQNKHERRKDKKDKKMERNERRKSKRNSK